MHFYELLLFIWVVRSYCTTLTNFNKKKARTHTYTHAQAAHLVYNGYWFSPEMQFLQNALDDAQRPVTGSVDVRLHKV